MSVLNKANDLSRSIIESNEFRELISAKGVIDSNGNYTSKIKDLKEKQFNFSMSIIPGKEPDKTKMQSIQNYYNELSQNPDMKRYLDAEKKFNEYISNIFKTISDKIESSLK